MTTTELAQILFSSPLQPSQALSASEIRRAVENHSCDLSRCAALVAQEAGDHPESYAARMRWALTAVERAFAPALAA
ncbi:hypothetical protein [Nonomuraea sp. NPDC050310]|uniref:hypothetical protein n=1 Tax=unclassified Nonomuraea TaxID=2593643 RepID=UPI0033CB162F